MNANRPRDPASNNDEGLDDSVQWMPVHASLIGLPLTSPEIGSLQAAFGFTHQRIGATDFFESARHGLSLLTCRGFVDSVYYASGNDAGYARFQGALPMGLTFDMTAQQVHARLGQPDQHQDAFYIERWDLAVCALAVQYTSEKVGIRYVILEARHLFLDPY